jgi:hypothetical protein
LRGERKMQFLPGILVLPIIFGFIGFIVFSALKKSKSGIKDMLLGINITLFGGILAVDPNSNLGGIEYIIVLLGLIISIIGLKKEN